ARDSRRVADWVGLRGEMTIAGFAQVALAAAVILALFDHRFAYVSLDASCIQFYLLPSSSTTVSSSVGGCRIEEGG
ncbi:MAG: hypothetical protein NZM04_02670, partial [Methylacidiphilales bacterium]|nr:hypothetical protein [Candidatus Methylacidiphilales bacterium]